MDITGSCALGRNADIDAAGQGSYAIATLEFVRYSRSIPDVVDGVLQWSAAPGHKTIDRLPQICWADGRSWAEANLWARNQAVDDAKDIETVISAMVALHSYANWLEAEGLSWWHFPDAPADRCLNKFRGDLVSARDGGLLAPSTVSSRMAAVVRFYRWVKAKRLLTVDKPLWEERVVGIRVRDAFGFENTLNVRTTSLSIPNRKPKGVLELEDGISPVTIPTMRKIVQLAADEASYELLHMLRLGFETGLRLGSICDLKVQTLLRAARDPVAGWHRLSVGPGASPPVATKFAVTGAVPIPDGLLQELRSHITSTRRLMRQALAAPEHRDLLFLTRFGKPYAGAGSRAVNVEMGRLRKIGLHRGVGEIRDFHFHRTRATFATELMRAALTFMPVAAAVSFVRDCCLHADDATTMKYVKFIESSKTMAQAADAFTQAFMGLAQRETADA